MTVVSQGCRPIGKPFVITKAERNIIYELGGKPAMAQLREIFDTLPTSGQQLVQRALHVGPRRQRIPGAVRAGRFPGPQCDRHRRQQRRDCDRRLLRPGQTVQFHVRDEEAADAELKQLLSTAKKNCSSPPAVHCCFTCNGRGTHMFSQPNHDAAAVAQRLRHQFRSPASLLRASWDQSAGKISSTASRPALDCSPRNCEIRLCGKWDCGRVLVASATSSPSSER